MLYQFSREDIKKILNQEFVKTFLTRRIDVEEFLKQLRLFSGELGLSQHTITTFAALVQRSPKNLLCMEIYDGTTSQEAGQVLKLALGQISNHVDILVYPIPGEEDIPGFEIVRYLIERSYDNGRNQVELRTFEKEFLALDIVQDNPRTIKMILLEVDIYKKNSTNWEYGSTTRFKVSGRGTDFYMEILIISKYRMKHELMLFDTVAHEIGHLLGVAPRGRSNTEVSLGIHCTNNLCVMQQKLEGSEALSYTNLRHEMRAPLFCRQCENDIEKFRSSFSIHDLSKINILLD